MFLGLAEMTFGLVYASFSLSSFKNDFLCTLPREFRLGRRLLVDKKPPNIYAKKKNVTLFLH